MSRCEQIEYQSVHLAKKNKTQKDTITIGIHAFIEVAHIRSFIQVTRMHTNNVIHVRYTCFQLSNKQVYQQHIKYHQW